MYRFSRLLQDGCNFCLSFSYLSYYVESRFHEKEEKWKLLNETQTEKEEALNVRNASLERTVQKYLREIDTLKNRYFILFFFKFIFCFMVLVGVTLGLRVAKWARRICQNAFRSVAAIVEFRITNRELVTINTK